MEKAQEARAANTEGEELDTIKLAVVNAIAQGDTGLVDAGKLQDELDKISTVVNATGDYAVRDKSPAWTVLGKKTNNTYTIMENGEVLQDTTWQNAFEFPEFGGYKSYTLDDTTMTLNMRSGPRLERRCYDRANCCDKWKGL